MFRNRNIGITFSKKELILSLLEADLRNTKLLDGLNEAGVVTLDFYTDLCTTILKLFGFSEEEREDRLYTLYFDVMAHFTKQPTRDFLDRLKEMTLEMYIILLEQRLRME